jgi:hypothetical protein
MVETWFHTGNWDVKINTMGSKSITHKNAKISRSDEDELEKKGAVLNVLR